MGNRKGRRAIGPSVRALRNDLGELLGRFDSPRSIRRELDRILGDWPEQGATQRPSWWRGGPAALPRRRRLTTVLDAIMRMMGLSRRADGSVAEDVEVLTERSDSYVVRVDFPDVRERDIDVRLDGELLTISGEHHHESARREQGCAYTERHYNSFSRSIELPRGIDTQKVEAHYAQGVLEVLLPKREALRPKQIPIVRHDVRGQGHEHEVRRGVMDANGAAPRRSNPTVAMD